MLGVRWVGVAADEYEATVAFFRDVLGMHVRFEEPLTVELETADGDAVQVMAPAHRYHEFFRAQSGGPVPLFEVDDVAEAQRELAEAGVELVGAPDCDDAWEWIHVRGPDGNLYELASRLK